MIIVDHYLKLVIADSIFMLTNDHISRRQDVSFLAFIYNESPYHAAAMH